MCIRDSTPEDAFTVTGTLGATPVARSAGKTSRTAGVDVGVGVGVGVAEICPAPGAAELVVPAGVMPWQALNTRLKTTRATAKPPPDRDLTDGAFTSYRLSGNGHRPMLHRTPREAGHNGRRATSAGCLTRNGYTRVLVRTSLVERRLRVPLARTEG